MPRVLTGWLRALAILALASPDATRAQPVSIGETDLGGVVTGANGPEAGVWVIAETTDLPTKFAKIVVTDDQGRYVLPELPRVNYSVWVRGYGLVDSAKVEASPGRIVNLQAVPAPDERAAAQYYPSIYWLAMLDVPAKSEFPGTGATGNKIPRDIRTQSHWLDGIKTHGCNTCHQIGNLATRTFPEALGKFDSSADAWFRRIHSGQSSELMLRNIGRLDVPRAIKHFADWTDRIAAGETPFAKPRRPQGVERNIVVTMWDWSRPYVYIHDEIGTDKRDPRVNANGPIYGSPEWSTDMVPVLDPVTHTAREIKLPVRDPRTASSREDPMYAPSPYWGEERIWDSQTSPHNPMMDHRSRVWFTQRIRNSANPAWCQKGSNHPSAKALPLARSARQLSVYDPATQKVTLIDTCFSTHHLEFAEDANHTLWLSTGFGGNGGNEAIGWLDTRKFDETGDEQASQGWTALVLDTNGNGRRDDYAGPRDPIDPAKDKRILASLYGIAYSPVDGSIWGSVVAFPGAVVRIAPGQDPVNTALAEIYEVPFNDPRTPFSGYSPRGFDIDRDGVAWVPLASGHMASFDRRKCKVLNGPTATGKHCPEGWTLYPFPGPQYRGVTESGSAEASYFTWVDQHDTLGLGRGVPLATGNLSDSLHALVNGEFVQLRVPYPMGFFSKGMDGRIDDPAAGWKGKGLWSNYAQRAPFHIEGGKNTRPKVVKFQLRPDPLAR